LPCTGRHKHRNCYAPLRYALHTKILDWRIYSDLDKLFEMGGESEKPKIKRVPADPNAIIRTARLRSDLALAGVFRLPPKRVADQRLEATNAALSLPLVIKTSTLTVSCPVALVSSDEDVLVALLAIAGVPARRSALYSSSESYRKALGEDGSAKKSAILIEIERSEMIKVLGWGKSGATYEALSHSLGRLAATSITQRFPDGEIKSNLIGFPENPWETVSEEEVWPPIWRPHGKKRSTGSSDRLWSSAGYVELVISPFLAEAIWEPKPKVRFGLHILEERRALTPSARGLYSHLVSLVWPGKGRQFDWDSVIDRLYRERLSSGKRSTAVRLLLVLEATCSGWKLVLHGKGKYSRLEFKRPNFLSYHTTGDSKKQAVV
jgi:hypothetical protein